MPVTGIIEDGFKAKLDAATAVTALVPTSRIFAYMAPEGTPKPYIVIRRQGALNTAGHSTGSGGKAMTEVMVLCVGATYLASHQMAVQVEKALHGQRGLWASEDVRMCFSNGVSDASANPQLADEIGFPAALVTFRTCYTLP